jgi:hypothetical protein
MRKTRSFLSRRRGSPEDGVIADLVFLKVPEVKVVKNRLHLDLRPGDQAAGVARLASLLALLVLENFRHLHPAVVSPAVRLDTREAVVLSGAVAVDRGYWRAYFLPHPTSTGPKLFGSSGWLNA